MALALAALMAFGIAAPHMLDLRDASPRTAIVLWSNSLALRALVSVFVVLSLLLVLPHSDIFNAITHWCWHAVLPLLATHLGLDGHRVGDIATTVPALALLASSLSVLAGVAAAARSLHRLIARHRIGTGPDDSVVVGGPEVLLAAAGLVRPRILVSAGALTTLDNEELAAGLAHERGHIARRHRYFIVFAALCRAAGRPVPGARRAFSELAFQLERDADHFALRRHDRLALASAICKAAMPQAPSFGLTALGGSGVAERLRQLLDNQTAQSQSSLRLILASIAALTVWISVASATIIPAATIAAASDGDHDILRHCET